MVQINSSCGLFGLLNIYSCRFGFGVTLLLCSEVRKLGSRPAKSVGQKPGTPGIRNEIRKSKTWTNTKKIHGSRRPKVQRHELNYLLTFSKDYENMMATMA